MISLLSGILLTLNSNKVARWLKLKHAAHKIFTVGLVLFYYS